MLNDALAVPKEHLHIGHEAGLHWGTANSMQ
jgi:hypothetical protein